MNKTLTGALLGALIIFVSLVVYLNYFKIPSLTAEIDRLENLPPTVVTEYLPGKIDTVVVRDTVEVFKPISNDPVLVSQVEELQRELRNRSMESQGPPPVKNYETTFEDSLIKGTIYNTVIGEGYLKSANVIYKFNSPIYMISRVDTLKRTETRTITKFVPGPRPIRLQAGVMGGASPQGTISFGPSVGLLNKNDDSFSYSYDVINDAHYVTYRRTIRFPKINLNPFK